MQGKKVHDFVWTSRDGEGFPAKRWCGSSEPSYEVIGLHGMGGAPSDFDPLGMAVADDGGVFWALTVRGQGGDPEISRRGAEVKAGEILKDFADFVEDVVSKGCRKFYIGESLGALLLAQGLSLPGRLNEPEGAIFSAPVVGLRREVPLFARELLRWAARIIPRGRLRLGWLVNGSSFAPRVTRDDEWADRQRESPHYVQAFTYQALVDVGELIEGSWADARGVKCPCLVLAAGRDIYVTVEQVRRWYELIGSAEKGLIVYPEAFHVLWNDWDRDQVLGDILRWIRGRL